MSMQAVKNPYRMDLTCAVASCAPFCPFENRGAFVTSFNMLPPRDGPLRRLVLPVGP